MQTKVRAGGRLGRARSQYLLVSLEQGMSNVRLGHGTNQSIREPGLEADSVGDCGLTPVGLPYQLFCLRAGVGDGLS